MLVPLSWLREVVPGLPAAPEVEVGLTGAGLEVESVSPVGSDVTGVVVGEVLDIEVVSAKKKDVRFVHVRTSPDPAEEPRGIVCGAFNFAVGDRVAVALPGALLPGGFAISARKTYGHVSDGMICSARELGVADEHTGILVLPPSTPLGADVVALLDLVDDVLEIDVTPDRGYALSLRGLGREAATAFGLPFADPASMYEVPAAVAGSAAGNGAVGSAGSTRSAGGAAPAAAAGSVGSAAAGGGAAYPVTIDDTTGCDRYVARVVTGLDPSGSTPLVWQRRLTLSGMRPISLAVDVTNAVMLGLGQPLHAFDRAKLRGPIVVRRAVAGERLRTLDGVDRTLDPEDLVIADDSGPVALAGVMGGESTEIGPETTEIVLEAAHFDSVTVARTVRRHGLPSEASRRFERGVDPALAPAAAEAAVRMFAEYGGALAEPGVTDVDARAPLPHVAFRVGETERLAGRPYPPEVVRARLADVGCTVAGDDPLDVVPPSWRPDLLRPADLVEEVARLEGYDTIPSVLPSAWAGRGLTPAQHLRRTAAVALANAGYVEVLTLPFVGGDAADRLGLPADDPRRAAVRVANPLAEDAGWLRTTLLPGLFSTAVRNVGRGEVDLSLTEAGLVFRATPGMETAPVTPPVDRRPTDAELAALDAALPDQPRSLAVVLTGRRGPAGWWGPGRPAEWSDAVDAIRQVAAAVRVPLTVGRGEAMPWHPGRCAALSVDGTVIGYAGELHPRVVADYDLPRRTCAAEIDLDALVAAGVAEPPTVAPLVSPYPPADRDVALVVPREVPVADVAAALRAGAGPLLESLRLFDVYVDERLGDEARSLAFGLRLRAPDRTLTAQEANDARDAAVAAAEERTGARLRAA